jgi:hypothetical protein
VTCASLSIFEHPITSSSAMVKPILAFGWRTTASHAGQAGWTMTFSSSSSSPITWLTWPDLGSITYPGTRSIVGKVSRRYSRHLSWHVCVSWKPWDMKGCRLKQGESIRGYIQRFSRKCHKLHKICDADIILAFWCSMNCQTLLHELGRD